jgi:Xaa-Pro aminopeptidase
MKSDLPSEHITRNKNVRTRLKEKRVDVLLVLNTTNIRYLCGYTGEFAALLVFKKSSYLITHYRNDVKAERDTTGCTIHPIVRDGLLHPNDVIVEAAKIISDHKAKTIAVDSGLDHQRFFNIRNQLKPHKLIQTDIVEGCRSIKSDYEIKMLKKAQKEAEKILHQFLNEIKPGLSEKQLHFKLLSLIYENAQLDGPSFLPIIASGESAWTIHSYYTDRKLKKNDSVIIDMGVKYQGYCSDMTRTIFIGKPTAKKQKVYTIVAKSLKAAEEKIKSGIFNHSADKASRDIIIKSGYGEYYSHGLGHSIGMDNHEAPYLSYVKKRQILEKNMLFTIEPGIYLKGEFGVRIEDTVLVSKTGCENITHFPKELLII